MGTAVGWIKKRRGERSGVEWSRGQERRGEEMMSQRGGLILSYLISDQTRSISSRLVRGFRMERPSTPPTVLQPVFPLNEHMPRRDFKKEKNLIHSATRRFMWSKEQITHTSKRPRISRIRIYLVLSRLHRSQVARWSPKWIGSKPRY